MEPAAYSGPANKPALVQDAMAVMRAVRRVSAECQQLDLGPDQTEQQMRMAWDDSLRSYAHARRAAYSRSSAPSLGYLPSTQNSRTQRAGGGRIQGRGRGGP